MLEMMMRGARPEAPPPDPDKKPWILQINDKSELHKLYLQQVFQPDVPLPTMTLAECAEIEMQQVEERTAAQRERQERQEWESSDRYWRGDRQGTREEDEDDA